FVCFAGGAWGYMEMARAQWREEQQRQAACQGAARTGERLGGGFRWRGAGDRWARRRWTRAFDFPILQFYREETGGMSD
ncbi:MAG TPA: hypothetical protein VLQ80_22560, partial [Candidatus Saccharimonadia bacterium]|nr:hypothetical protein [Candidatus Saccharimonadia bacterium]